MRDPTPPVQSIVPQHVEVCACFTSASLESSANERALSSKQCVAGNLLHGNEPGTKQHDQQTLQEAPKAIVMDNTSNTQRTSSDDAMDPMMLALAPAEGDRWLLYVYKLQLNQARR